MSTVMYLASETALPPIETLASWFEDRGGAELRDDGAIVLAQSTPIEVVALADVPAQVRALKPAQRKTIVCAHLGIYDVVDNLAIALGGMVFTEEGERLFHYAKAKVPAKRKLGPKIDISIPAEMQAAFFGHYLPVLAARDTWAVTLQKIATSFTAAQRKQIGYSRLGGDDFRAGELDAKVVEPSFYARELDTLNLSGVTKIVRVMPKHWFATQPRSEDEQLVLGMLCALARLSRGVIYSRPGGLKLEPNGDTTIAVAFDFATGVPIQRAVL